MYTEVNLFQSSIISFFCLKGVRPGFVCGWGFKDWGMLGWVVGKVKLVKMEVSYTVIQNAILSTC